MFRVASLLKKFRAQRCGSVSLMAGLVFPVVSVASLFALDHMAITKQQANLQNAVDEAALTTVRGLRFVREGTVAQTVETDQRETTLSSIADAVVRNLVTKNGVLGDLKTTATRTDQDSVDVAATLFVETPFGSLTGLGGKAITASAQAQLYGARNICVIALGTDNQVGINVEQSARIKSGNCGIYSNSTSVSSVNARDSSLIDAPFICAAGGYTGGVSNTSSAVVTDCPQVTDPLAARPLPETPATCDYSYANFTEDEDITLEPGHYCGGLIISGDAEVQMNPGVYVISDGPLLVQNEAELVGESVAILMDDEKGSIYFNDNALVNLSAPVTGPMAGIVISSRKVCGGTDCHLRTFEIKSAQVSSLLGTIYVPEDRCLHHHSIPLSARSTIPSIGAQHRLRCNRCPRAGWIYRLRRKSVDRVMRRCL